MFRSSSDCASKSCLCNWLMSTLTLVETLTRCSSLCCRHLKLYAYLWSPPWPPIPKFPEALPDLAELSLDLPLINSKTHHKNKPRKRYERKYSSFLQIHDLHLWSWGWCICPWCWTTPTTDCPEPGSVASACTGSAPRTSHTRSLGRLSGRVHSCPAWPRTCTGELEGQ